MSASMRGLFEAIHARHPCKAIHVRHPCEASDSPASGAAPPPSLPPSSGLGANPPVPVEEECRRGKEGQRTGSGATRGDLEGMRYAWLQLACIALCSARCMAVCVKPPGHRRLLPP